MINAYRIYLSKKIPLVVLANMLANYGLELFSSHLLKSYIICIKNNDENGWAC